MKSIVLKEPKIKIFTHFYQNVILLKRFSPLGKHYETYCAVPKKFDFHWDLYIVQSMILLGQWSQAIKLLEHVLTSSNDALNPAHQSYARALKSYILFLLGNREGAIETYEMLVWLVYPLRQTVFDLLSCCNDCLLFLNMRIPSDENLSTCILKPSISHPCSLITSMHEQTNHPSRNRLERSVELLFDGERLPIVHSKQPLLDKVFCSSGIRPIN